MGDERQLRKRERNRLLYFRRSFGCTVRASGRRVSFSIGHNQVRKALRLFSPAFSIFFFLSRSYHDMINMRTGPGTGHAHPYDARKRLSRLRAAYTERRLLSLRVMRRPALSVVMLPSGPSTAM